MYRLRNASVYFYVLLINCICIPAPDSFSEYFVQQEKTNQIINTLVFNNKEDEVGAKWDTYIRELTRRFGNNDYQMAIHKLKLEYDQSYVNLNTCIESTNKVSEQYSTSWTKDFQERFDREYIQKNLDAIRFVVQALAMRNNLASCNEQTKEALYREYRHLDAAQNYVKKFVDFTETLNKEEKKKIGTKIMAVESYLKSFEYPLQSTLSDEGLKDALFSIALKTRKESDPRLIDFFINHPLFMKPFALIKTLDDLKSLQ